MHQRKLVIRVALAATILLSLSSALVSDSDVVLHYERHLSFVFTDQERADLVAFLNAL